MTPSEMANSLGLPALKDRKWQIFKTSATKGTGLDEAMEWLSIMFLEVICVFVCTCSCLQMCNFPLVLMKFRLLSQLFIILSSFGLFFHWPSCTYAFISPTPTFYTQISQLSALFLAFPCLTPPSNSLCLQLRFSSQQPSLMCLHAHCLEHTHRCPCHRSVT